MHSVGSHTLTIMPAVSSKKSELSISGNSEPYPKRGKHCAPSAGSPRPCARTRGGSTLFSWRRRRDLNPYYRTERGRNEELPGLGNCATPENLQGISRLNLSFAGIYSQCAGWVFLRPQTQFFD